MNGTRLLVASDEILILCVRAKGIRSSPIAGTTSAPATYIKLWTRTSLRPRQLFAVTLLPVCFGIQNENAYSAPCPDCVRHHSPTVRFLAVPTTLTMYVPHTLLRLQQPSVLEARHPARDRLSPVRWDPNRQELAAFGQAPSLQPSAEDSICGLAAVDEKMK